MDYRDIIKTQLLRFVDIELVVLYGSILETSRFGPNSDIDIAVFSSNQKLDKLAILAELHEINRNIDLVDMKTTNPVLGVQIIKQHEILIMKNPKIWDSWMRNMLCQYHDLTIARRDLIRDLGKYSVFGD